MEHRVAQEIMSRILTFGTLLSIVLVIIGGLFYLLENSSYSYMISVAQTWLIPNRFSAISIIELGVICLVGTQVLRVLLLTIFYITTRDYYFTAISLFIFVTLLVSLFGKH